MIRNSRRFHDWQVSNFWKYTNNVWFPILSLEASFPHKNIYLKKTNTNTKTSPSEPQQTSQPALLENVSLSRKNLSCSSHKGCSTSGIPWMHPADCRRRSLGKSFENGSLRNGAVGGHPNGHHTYCCTYTWERGSLKTTSWRSVFYEVCWTKWNNKKKYKKNIMYI